MIQTLTFEMSDHYKGAGVSYGLDRGLLVYHNDRLLIEEGMGLGACAVQAGGYTYFTTVKSIEKSGNSYDVVFSIDTLLKHKIFGIRSRPLTKAIEFICTNIYMKSEKQQKILFKLTERLHKPLHLDVAFDKVKPLGEIRLNFEVLDDTILVDLSCETDTEGCTLFVMNELGGNLFDRGIVNGELSEPPSGWQKIDGLNELYSRTHALAFTMTERDVPDNVTSKLFWGREISAIYCWAGFESEIKFDLCKFEHYTYSVQFREETQWQ